jgi:plasmid replication initiation protein
MFELESAFTNIKLSIITAFKSFYSMRLYQILISWLDENRGIRRTPQYFTYEELKTILNVSDKYDWYEFNRRILTPAVKEINDLGDIHVEWKKHVGYKNKTEGISFMYGYKNVWNKTRIN